VVGAGNSGAEIALEVSREQRTLLAGSETGHVPFRIEGQLGRLLAPIVLRFLFHHVLTTRTPIGRRLRPKALSRGEPLVRTRPKELAAARVDRVPRVTGARNGMPVLEDGRALDVANIIWCTGFDAGFSRIDLPVLGDRAPDHDGGVVNAVPGLYFVGLKFLYSVSSAQVHGVGRDASRVAEAIAARHDRTTASELHPASPSAT
jgi:putative flavoprotein involved in K+ transport